VSDFEGQAKDLGLKVFYDVKNSLGDDWDGLTEDQKQSIAHVAEKIMELELRQKAGEDVTAKLEAVSSTIQDWKVWGELAVEEAFWKGVQKVAETIGSFLAAFATEALKRIVPGV